MSLQICWGFTQEARLPEVPVTGEERVELTLGPGTREVETVVVDPWPFAVMAQLRKTMPASAFGHLAGTKDGVLIPGTADAG